MWVDAERLRCGEFAFDTIGDAGVAGAPQIVTCELGQFFDILNFRIMFPLTPPLPEKIQHWLLSVALIAGIDNIELGVVRWRQEENDHSPLEAGSIFGEVRAAWSVDMTAE